MALSRSPPIAVFGMVKLGDAGQADMFAGYSHYRSGREQNHIIRAGLNYRFNWGGAVRGPVVAPLLIFVFRFAALG